MKLSDPSFLNMDKILKNLSDFMKKSHPRDAESQGEQKTENGTTMAEIKFAREWSEFWVGTARRAVPRFRRGCAVSWSVMRLAHFVCSIWAAD